MTSTKQRPPGPELDPRVAVLVRPSGTVQLGCDPERAVLLDLPGLDSEAVLGLLDLFDGMRSWPEIVWQAGHSGVSAERARQLLQVLERAGLIHRPQIRLGRVRTIRVHGTGPLADAIVQGLGRSGIRPVRSRADESGPRPGPADLVVLTDALVVDPRLVLALVRNHVAHFPVGIRDRRGIVGPLVLPGRTSCLGCAHRTRADLDIDWPYLSAQLLGRAGHASPAGIAATAALALAELETIYACSRSADPHTLEATLELDLDTHAVRQRHWAPHPGCGCPAAARRYSPAARRPGHGVSTQAGED